MKFRPPLSLPALRRAPGPWVWTLVVLLLLKLVMPAWAAAAAEWRGVSMAVICTEYGVKTVMLDASGQPVPVASEAPHGALPGACNLAGAVIAPAPAAPVAGLSQGPAREFLPPPRWNASVRPDPQWAWLVQRQHAPPLRG